MKWMVLLLMMVAVPAFAMRCGTELITAGQYSYEVLEHCGEPIEQHFVTQYLGSNGRYVILSPIVVEEWIYDFGPTRLQRRLLFQDGQLFRIDTLDRGIVIEDRD